MSTCHTIFFLSGSAQLIGTYARTIDLLQLIQYIISHRLNILHNYTIRTECWVINPMLMILVLERCNRRVCPPNLTALIIMMLMYPRNVFCCCLLVVRYGVHGRLESRAAGWSIDHVPRVNSKDPLLSSFLFFKKWNRSCTIVGFGHRCFLDLASIVLTVGAMVNYQSYCFRLYHTSALARDVKRPL